MKKHLSHKALSNMAWIVVGLQILTLLLTIRYSSFMSVILSLLAIVLQSVIAVTMKKENANPNHMFTLAIIFCVLDLGISSGIMLMLVLLKRFGKNTNAISKCWFIPFLVAAIIGGIKIGTAIGYGGMPFIALLSFLATFIQYYTISYWYFNNASERLAQENEKNAAVRMKQLAYYSELYQQGAITEDEWNRKKAEFDN